MGVDARTVVDPDHVRPPDPKCSQFTFTWAGEPTMEHADGKKVKRSRTLVTLLAGLAALSAFRPTPAVDAVIEINQARALAGGITTGDAAGYPIRIFTPGSYRLTGNLTTDGNKSGIEILSDDVSLDLNGFALTCAGGVAVDGISVPGFKNVEIRNGTIRGFTRSGIFTNINTQYVRVIGVTAAANTIMGIDLQGQGNIIDGCTALGHGNGMRAFEEI